MNDDEKSRDDVGDNKSEKHRQEAAQLFLGALLMPESELKQTALTLATRIFGSATAEKCDDCGRPQWGEGPQHNYACSHAKRCEWCGVRVDLGNTRHTDECADIKRQREAESAVSSALGFAAFKPVLKEGVTTTKRVPTLDDFPPLSHAQQWSPMRKK